MTKKELIEQLEAFSDDDVVICMGPDEGWSNIDFLSQKGSSIAIHFGNDEIFTDDKT